MAPIHGILFGRQDGHKVSVIDSVVLLQSLSKIRYNRGLLVSGVDKQQAIHKSGNQDNINTHRQVFSNKNKFGYYRASN